MPADRIGLLPTGSGRAGRRRPGLLVVLLLGLSACARSTAAPHPHDGDAVAACRHALKDVTEPKTLATTVSSGPNGWLVKAYRSGHAIGTPDYVCNLARDERADHGVNLLQVAVPHPSATR